MLAMEDLAAVQKPLFSTQGKMEVAAQVATIPTDPYVISAHGGISVGWYLSERLAVEYLFAWGNGRETSQSTRLQSLGVRVDAYMPRVVTSINTQWTPIYAKFSLLGMRVVHFDTSITGGVGALVAERTIYNDVEAAANADVYNRPASINVGINQRYFIRTRGQMFAIRADVRDYLYLLETLENSRVVKHNWYFGLGVSWFFRPVFEKGGGDG